MFTKSISSNALKTIFGSVRGTAAAAVASFIHMYDDKSTPATHTHLLNVQQQRNHTQADPTFHSLALLLL